MLPVPTAGVASREVRAMMKYCSQCGAPVVKKIPPGDHLPRHVCNRCEHIHYHNPKIVAGCIPEWESQILLCRRAIEPRLGLWTFPAGFMELGESTEEAAIRETLEEAHAAVKITALYAVLSLPHIGQVYLVFRGRMVAPSYKPGPESLEVRLFSLASIPWDQIAFPVVRETLRRYVDDVASGQFQLHLASLEDSLPSSHVPGG
ncbi:MAG: NUDIX hydrolase [Nitrospira sp.]|nr:NUDIX hydrolase [Nitrospira sp.]MCP9465009.1 NUDIX hydrolase [Nitrospira sp.]